MKIIGGSCLLVALIATLLACGAALVEAQTPTPRYSRYRYFDRANVNFATAEQACRSSTALPHNKTGWLATLPDNSSMREFLTINIGSASANVLTRRYFLGVERVGTALYWKRPGGELIKFYEQLPDGRGVCLQDECWFAPSAPINVTSHARVAVSSAPLSVVPRWFGMLPTETAANGFICEYPVEKMVYRAFLDINGASVNGSIEMCARQGGWLATFPTAESGAIVPLMNLRGTGPHWSGYYIGATDRVREDYWEWFTGPYSGRLFYIHNRNASLRQCLMYCSWYPGEPNDNGGEDDVTVGPTGTWSDYYGTVESKGAMCEFDPATPSMTRSHATSSATLAISDTLTMSVSEQSPSSQITSTVTQTTPLTQTVQLTASATLISSATLSRSPSRGTPTPTHVLTDSPSISPTSTEPLTATDVLTETLTKSVTTVVATMRLVAPAVRRISERELLAATSTGAGIAVAWQLVDPVGGGPLISCDAITVERGRNTSWWLEAVTSRTGNAPNGSQALAQVAVFVDTCTRSGFSVAVLSARFRDHRAVEGLQNLTLRFMMGPLLGNLRAPSTWSDSMPRQVVTATFELVDDVVPPPYDVPTDVVQGAENAAAAGSIVSSVGGNPAMAAQASRTAAILALLQCRAEVGEPLDWMSSPSGHSIGSGLTRYTTGACVVNVLIVVGFVFLHYLACVIKRGRKSVDADTNEARGDINFYEPDAAASGGDADQDKRKRREARAMNRAMAALRFPSLALVLALPLLEPTVSSATTTMRFTVMPSEAASRVAAALSLAAVLVGVCFLVFVTSKGFQSVYQRKDEGHQQVRDVKSDQLTDETTDGAETKLLDAAAAAAAAAADVNVTSDDDDETDEFELIEIVTESEVSDSAAPKPVDATKQQHLTRRRVGRGKLQEKRREALEPTFERIDEFTTVERIPQDDGSLKVVTTVLPQPHVAGDDDEGHAHREVAGRPSPLKGACCGSFTSPAAALSTFFFGDGFWVDARRGRGFVNRYWLFFDIFKEQRQFFLCVEVIVTVAVGVLNGWGPQNIGECRALMLSLTLFFAGFLIAVVVLRPYISMFNLATTLLVTLTQVLASSFATAYLFEMGAEFANYAAWCATGTLYLLTFKSVTDVILLLWELCLHKLVAKLAKCCCCCCCCCNTSASGGSDLQPIVTVTIIPAAPPNGTLGAAHVGRRDGASVVERDASAMIAKNPLTRQWNARRGGKPQRADAHQTTSFVNAAHQIHSLTSRAQQDRRQPRGWMHGGVSHSSSSDEERGSARYQTRKRPLLDAVPSFTGSGGTDSDTAERGQGSSLVSRYRAIVKERSERQEQGRHEAIRSKSLQPEEVNVAHSMALAEKAAAMFNPSAWTRVCHATADDADPASLRRQRRVRNAMRRPFAELNGEAAVDDASPQRLDLIDRLQSTWQRREPSAPILSPSPRRTNDVEPHAEGNGDASAWIGGNQSAKGVWGALAATTRELTAAPVSVAEVHQMAARREGSGDGVLRRDHGDTTSPSPRTISSPRQQRRVGSSLFGRVDDANHNSSPEDSGGGDDSQRRGYQQLRRAMTQASNEREELKSLLPRLAAKDHAGWRQSAAPAASDELPAVDVVAAIKRSSSLSPGRAAAATTPRRREHPSAQRRPQVEFSGRMNRGDVRGRGIGSPLSRVANEMKSTPNPIAAMHWITIDSVAADKLAK